MRVNPSTCLKPSILGEKREKKILSPKKDLQDEIYEAMK